MKKEIIKKYLEQVFKGGLIGLGLILGVTFGVLSIYAFNWSGVSTATTSTTLTANMWNTTMSTITGAVQTLENSMVDLTGNQTIAGTKTFSSPVVGQTPTSATHLATKSYVDSNDISIVRGTCDFTATAESMAYCSCNAGGIVDTQNKNIGLTGYKIISGGCNLDGTVGALNSTMIIGDDTWHCQSENTTYNVEIINIVCANF